MWGSILKFVGGIIISEIIEQKLKSTFGDDDDDSYSSTSGKSGDYDKQFNWEETNWNGWNDDDD